MSVGFAEDGAAGLRTAHPRRIRPTASGTGGARAAGPYAGRLQQAVAVDLAGQPPSSIRLERIINLNPRVRTSAVLDIRDAHNGEHRVAIVEPLPREQITRRELLSFLRMQLPSAAVPSAIIFVTEMPRGDTGQPDRVRLRAMYGSAGAGQDAS